MRKIMRTEKVMMDLILNTAIEDERIRAVYMNGSRTNPNVPKDIFQDYDIIYVVRETESFQKDKQWINRFGTRLYMQYPEDNGDVLGYESDVANCYGWLIQFADGNRLDLHVQTIEFSKQDIGEDKLCEILLDKDGLLPRIPDSTEEDYYVKKPSEREFLAVCNEFWWCLNNVAKGLWREEVPYVQDMLNLYIRPQLVKILSWKIGIEKKWSVSIGKSGKYMYRFLGQEDWNMFLKTYASYQIDEIWDSVIIMCELFDKTAKGTSRALNFIYETEEANASFEYLKHIRQLPKDTKAIY